MMRKYLSLAVVGVILTLVTSVSGFVSLNQDTPRTKHQQPIYMKIAVLSQNQVMQQAQTPVIKSKKLSTAKSKNEIQNGKRTSAEKLADQYYRYGIAMYSYHKYYLSDAQKELEALIKEAPQNPHLHLSAAKVYYRKLEFDKAEKEAREALKINPAEYEAHRLIGKIYMELFRSENKNEHFNTMVDAFQQVFKLNPNDTDETTLRILGLVYLQQGKFEKAKKALKRLILTVPNHPQAFKALEEIYLKEKNNAELLKLYSRRTELAPEEINTLVKLADLSFRIRRYEVAETALNKLSEYFTHNKEIVDKNNWALILRQLGFVLLRKNKAEKALERLIESRNLIENETTDYYIIITLMQQEKYKEARAELDSALETHKGGKIYPELVELNTQLLLKEGKKREALQSIDDLIKSSSNNLNFKIRKVLLLIESKDYEEANQYLAELYKDNPSEIRIIFQMGAVNERLKNIKEAEKYFKLALKLEPDNAMSLNYLAYMWAEAGVNLEQAESMIRKALKKDPANSAYLDTLGWIYFKMKNYPKARFYLEKSVKVGPAGNEIFDHLGDLYFELNLVEEAIQSWKKAIKPNSPQIDYEKINQKIEAATKKLKK